MFPLDHTHLLQVATPPPKPLRKWRVGWEWEGPGEKAKLTDRCGNRDPWREEAHRQRARAQLDTVFTHSNTVG